MTAKVLADTPTEQTRSSRQTSRQPETPRRRRLRLAVHRTATKASLWEAFARAREMARPVVTPTSAALRCVSGLGWLVVAAAVIAWAVGWALGWREFMYAGVALATLFTLACLLTIGRTSLDVSARLTPARVVAGDSTAAAVTVKNVGKAPLLPVPLDLPTGDSLTRFNLPPLGPGGEFQDVVILPSRQRGLYVVGPASTLRGDPFGIVRRKVTWTEPLELFVHPRTIYLNGLGSGMLKDLEGRSTNDMSMSDLAFHTLREYDPGDDRRHIHWLSTAKRSGTTGEPEFMVRQFLDTRRSHIAVIVDCNDQAWVDPEEFETAISAGASVATRALRDEQDVSEACGPFQLTRPKRHTAIDLFSRARLGEESLETVTAHLAHIATNISAAIVFTGPLTTFTTIRRAASVFGPDVNVVVVRVEHGAPISLQRTGGRSILTIGALADLPRALSGKVTV